MVTREHFQTGAPRLDGLRDEEKRFILALCAQTTIPWWEHSHADDEGTKQALSDLITTRMAFLRTDLGVMHLGYRGQPVRERLLKCIEQDLCEEGIHIAAYQPPTTVTDALNTMYDLYTDFLNVPDRAERLQIAITANFAGFARDHGLERNPEMLSSPAKALATIKSWNRPEAGIAARLVTEQGSYSGTAEVIRRKLIPVEQLTS